MADTLSRLSAALADRYRVHREIGAGGMATVFVADDLKHNRKVAIKVLKEDLAASVGGTRFLREIQIAAQLQHPNILPLLDSGDDGGLLYYVMPFVDGQSLRQRLVREHELPIGDAVRLIVEVVDALAHAHSRGVVHRDIKPDNVMLSGRHALVTDFGVARAVSQASGQSNVTSMGVALGTPTYMAPEQAAADPNIDQRADIYAVGVLAYELIGGRPPFAGATPQQVLAAHVTEQPDPLSRHRPGVSPALEAVVMRCLEKRPADRWQSADELLVALEPLATPSGGTAPTAARIPAVSSGGGLRRFAIPMTVAGVAVVALAVIIFFMTRRDGAAQVALGRSDALTNDPGLEIYPAISPDGKFVAYSSGNSAALRVFVRPVGGGGGRAIPLSDDSTSLEWMPKWSPDGTRLLFLDGAGGVRVSPAFGGGTSRPVVAPGAVLVPSATWSPSGDSIAFVRDDTLFATALNGSAARVVAVERELSACDWSPNGRWLACARGNSLYLPPGGSFGNLAPSTIVLIPLGGGTPVDLATANTGALNHSPVWSADSRQLYFVSTRDGPRDVYLQQVRGDGTPDGDAIRLSTGLGAHTISVSRDGSRLAYAVLNARSNIWALPIPHGAGPVTADGAVQITSGNQVIEGVRVSPDGKWIVYDSNLRGNQDVYRVSVSGGGGGGGGQPEQLTNEPFDEFAPDLSPDGKYVAYHAFRTPGLRQIEVKPLDGGPVEMATRTQNQESNPIWSPDGTQLVSFDLVPPFRLGVVRRIAPGNWAPPVNLCVCAGAGWSPDGKALLVGSFNQRNNTVEMRLEFLDRSPPRILLSRALNADAPEGASYSRDGREIYYKAHDPQGRASIWVMPAAGGEPRRLVHFTNFDRPSFRPGFSVDASRFYFTIEDRQSDVFVAELIAR